MRYDISRRTLLRGGLGVAGAGALAAPIPTQAPRSDAAVYGVTTVNPLITQRADPFITQRVKGRYYFTGSVPEYDRVIVRGATTIAGLSTATESVVWRRPASGRMAGHIWAPELHRINGRWYIYFAAGDSDDVFRVRMYVLESALADPTDPAGWTLRGQIATEWDSFSLDATTFAHRGRRYLVWAQGEPEIAVNSSLYIAAMRNPWTLATKPTRIATPTRGWETQGYKVNEGPAVLVRNGRVFLTFSASATDARYCMGLLTADARADLLDNASWTKTPDPVFVTNTDTQRYGPGHNSFTIAEDGVTDVLVYHARDYRDITGDPLYDPNRHTRVQRLYWHPDGTPLFGVPVGDGGPIIRLSPTDARTSYVRHAGAELRVEPSPRELGATQFRFVPETGVLQSVDAPGSYVSLAGGVARLDPVGTAFRRLPRGRGVVLQVAADTSSYLHHSETRLIRGGPTVFLLS